MHRTPPLIFDPAAARARLLHPTRHGPTRAKFLAVGDKLTGRGVERFLRTVHDVLTAQPDGLNQRTDIAAVEL
jgi:hypothetical protein